MIKLLKSIVSWLERRFPEKLYISPDDFMRQNSAIFNLQESLKKMEGFSPVGAMEDIFHLAEEIKEIKKSLAALKEGIVKGEIKATALTQRDQQRQEFIEGNFERPTIGRKELEAQVNGR